MKNKIIIISLLTLLVFALGSFLMNGLTGSSSSKFYIWNYNDNYQKIRNDDEKSSFFTSTNISKVKKGVHRGSSRASSASVLNGLKADGIVSSTFSSSFSSLNNNQATKYSLGSSSKQGNTELGFYAFSLRKKGRSNNLLASNVRGHLEQGTSSGFTGGAFGAPGYSGGTFLIDPGAIDPNESTRISGNGILIDPSTDPNESTRIPVGNATWFMVLLASVYVMIKKYF